MEEDCVVADVTVAVAEAVVAIGTKLDGNVGGG